MDERYTQRVPHILECPSATSRSEVPPCMALGTDPEPTTLREGTRHGRPHGV